MKETGSPFETMATWYREQAVAARRIADQIEATAKAAGVLDTTRRPYNITWTESPHYATGYQIEGHKTIEP